MFEVVPVPAFEDNYIWLLVRGSHAVAVDPGDAQPVFAHLAQHALTLTAILCTHHHGDHVGGNRALIARFPVPVYGPAAEPIPALTHPVQDGDTIALPELDARFEVIGVPGHTAGHVAYYGAGCLFCGDTLFACGCGRLFEGTPAQMHASLARLAALPDDTAVYCAHEYTLASRRRWSPRTVPCSNARSTLAPCGPHIAPPFLPRSRSSGPPIPSCAAGCPTSSPPRAAGRAFRSPTRWQCSRRSGNGRTASTKAGPGRQRRLTALRFNEESC